jgi:hypothetical protein
LWWFRDLRIFNARAAWMFHIPPRIALLGWSRGFIVDYGGQFRGDGRVLNVPMSDFDNIGACAVDVSRVCRGRRMERETR